MNKIYKSIWNHVTRTFTAVSEIQQTNGKKAKTSLKEVAIAMSLVLASGSVYGYGGVKGDPVEGNQIFSIGINTPFQVDSDNTNIESNTLFKISDDKLSSANLSSNVLFNLSSKVFEQRILTTNNINLDYAIRNGSAHIANTTLNQRQGNIATLTFAVGNEAYDLIKENIDSYSPDANMDNQIFVGEVIRVPNGEIGPKNYYQNGLAYHNSDKNGGIIWTLAILKQADIDQYKTLELSGISGKSNVWSAKITGSGNIAYSGSGTLNIETTLFYDANGSEYDDVSTYTGTTTVTGTDANNQLIVNLNKTQSFGLTSSVTATNATINVNQAKAWESTGGLHLTNSTVNFTTDQSGFTVTNSTGDTANTASFSGTNSISGGANSFTYLIRGDAQVVDGTTTFAGTNIKTQVAGSLTLHSVGGIANDTAIEIGGALNFVGAGATPTKQTLTQTFAAYDDTDDKYTVNLSKGSNIKYASGSILSGVLTTSLSDVSKLETDNQSNLGNLVMFNRQSDKARSQLTLKLASGAENLTLTTNLSGDGLTILDAGQDDGTNAKISLDSGVDLSNYSGWIRLENGVMNLDDNAVGKLNRNQDDTTGLSLGASATLTVSGQTTRELDRFGWQSDTGVLDLTGFDFTDQFEGALSVENLLYPTGGIIKLDVQEVAGEVPTDIATGSVFALDDGQAGQLLIETTLPSEDISTIEFQDKDGHELEKSRNQNYYSQNDSTGRSVAAVGSWSWTARYHDNVQNSEGETVNGIYASYALDKLTLTNGTEDGNNGPLLASAALVGETTAQSYRLNTEIDGRGIFEIKAGEDATDNKFVQLNNQKNTYTGATVVLGSTELQYIGGALGNSTVILSGAGANLTSASQSFDGEAISGNQAINGLYTDSAQHTITLNQDTTLTIAGNADEDWSEEAVNKYFGDTAPTQNVLGVSTRLSGSGTFSIGSDHHNEAATNGISLTAESAEVFNNSNYDGTVQLAGTGSSLTIVGEADLTGGNFATTNNAANAAITVDTNATIDEDNANFNGYTGTLNTTAHTYTVTSTGALGSSSIVANGSTIVFSGVTDGAITNSVTKSDVTTFAPGDNRWELTNASNVTLNDQSASQTGYDVVEIEGDATPSTLTLVSGTTNPLGGRDDGGLGKFSDSVAFVGNGNLNLSGYMLSSSELKFAYENESGSRETFTGTLGLLGLTQYTLLSNASYGVALNTGTLVVGGSEHLSTTALSFTGTENVLDLTNAVADSERAVFFTVNGNIQASNAATDKLTVIISEAQRSEEVANKNILDQDDGDWGQWLVDGQDGGNISSNNLEIKVGDKALANFTQNLPTSESGAATGYYKAEGFVWGGARNLDLKVQAL